MEVVINNIVPAKPIAAASSSIPNMEINNMSARSTANKATKPIADVSDMVMMCLVKSPVTNLA